MSAPIKADTHTCPLRCRKCGSNRFVVPAHSTNESIVTCTDCGPEIGRWATCESASLKKPTGKGRQTCRPARSACPSWPCGVADSPVPKSCLEGYNSFNDFLFLPFWWVDQN